MDGIGLGSDDAFAAAGEEVGIAEFYERFMVVDVDGCEGGGGGDCEANRSEEAEVGQDEAHAVAPGHSDNSD